MQSPTLNDAFILVSNRNAGLNFALTIISEQGIDF